MSRTFRPWAIDQPLLLPPNVQDFVGEDHPARFVLALALDNLDLRAIEAVCASERVPPPFDPAMMTGCCCTAIATASTRRAGSPGRRASGWTS